MPDQIFADPRLAAIYDDIDGDRADLDHYEAIVDKLGARSVLDIGCGTGVLACRLARRGVTMIGLDPVIVTTSTNTEGSIVGVRGLTLVGRDSPVFGPWGIAFERW